MIITELKIKHFEVRISEFEDLIFDKNILPIFTTPSLLKEEEIKKWSKYKIETLNTTNKVNFKVVTFYEISKELISHINKVSNDLELYYYSDPSKHQTLTNKIKDVLNKYNLKEEKKEINKSYLKQLKIQKNQLKVRRNFAQKRNKKANFKKIFFSYNHRLNKNFFFRPTRFFIPMWKWKRNKNKFVLKKILDKKFFKSYVDNDNKKYNKKKIFRIRFILNKFLFKKKQRAAEKKKIKKKIKYKYKYKILNLVPPVKGKLRLSSPNSRRGWVGKRKKKFLTKPKVKVRVAGNKNNYLFFIFNKKNTLKINYRNYLLIRTAIKIRKSNISILKKQLKLFNKKQNKNKPIPQRSPLRSPLRSRRKIKRYKYKYNLKNLNSLSLIFFNLKNLKNYKSFEIFDSKQNITNKFKNKTYYSNNYKKGTNIWNRANNFNNNILLSSWIPISKGALKLMEDQGWDLDLLSTRNTASLKIKKLRPYKLKIIRRLRRLRRLRLFSANLFLYRSNNIERIQKEQENQGRNNSKLIFFKDLLTSNIAGQWRSGANSWYKYTEDAINYNKLIKWEADTHNLSLSSIIKFRINENRKGYKFSSIYINKENIYKPTNFYFKGNLPLPVINNPIYLNKPAMVTPILNFVNPYLLNNNYFSGERHMEKHSDNRLKFIINWLGNNLDDYYKKSYINNNINSQSTQINRLNFNNIKNLFLTVKKQPIQIPFIEEDLNLMATVDDINFKILEENKKKILENIYLFNTNLIKVAPIKRKKNLKYQAIKSNFKKTFFNRRFRIRHRYKFHRVTGKYFKFFKNEYIKALKFKFGNKYEDRPFNFYNFKRFIFKPFRTKNWKWFNPNLKYWRQPLFIFKDKLKSKRKHKRLIFPYFGAWGWMSFKYKARINSRKIFKPYNPWNNHVDRYSSIYNKKYFDPWFDYRNFIPHKNKNRRGRYVYRKISIGIKTFGVRKKTPFNWKEQWNWLIKTNQTQYLNIDYFRKANNKLRRIEKEREILRRKNEKISIIKKGPYKIKIKKIMPHKDIDLKPYLFDLKPTHNTPKFIKKLNNKFNFNNIIYKKKNKINKIKLIKNLNINNLNKNKLLLKLKKNNNKFNNINNNNKFAATAAIINKNINNNFKKNKFATQNYNKKINIDKNKNKKKLNFNNLTPANKVQLGAMGVKKKNIFNLNLTPANREQLGANKKINNNFLNNKRKFSTSASLLINNYITTKNYSTYLFKTLFTANNLAIINFNKRKKRENNKFCDTQYGYGASRIRLLHINNKINNKQFRFKKIKLKKIPNQLTFQTKNLKKNNKPLRSPTRSPSRERGKKKKEMNLNLNNINNKNIYINLKSDQGYPWCADYLLDAPLPPKPFRLNTFIKFAKLIQNKLKARMKPLKIKINIFNKNKKVAFNLFHKTTLWFLKKNLVNNKLYTKFEESYNHNIKNINIDKDNNNDNIKIITKEEELFMLNLKKKNHHKFLYHFYFNKVYPENKTKTWFKLSSLFSKLAAPANRIKYKKNNIFKKHLLSSTNNYSSEARTLLFWSIIKLYSDSFNPFSVKNSINNSNNFNTLPDSIFNSNIKIRRKSFNSNSYTAFYSNDNDLFDNFNNYQNIFFDPTLAKKKKKKKKRKLKNSKFNIINMNRNIFNSGFNLPTFLGKHFFFKNNQNKKVIISKINNKINKINKISKTAAHINKINNINKISKTAAHINKINKKKAVKKINSLINKNKHKIIKNWFYYSKKRRKKMYRRWKKIIKFNKLKRKNRFSNNNYDDIKEFDDKINDNNRRFLFLYFILPIFLSTFKNFVVNKPADNNLIKNDKISIKFNSVQDNFNSKNILNENISDLTRIPSELNNSDHIKFAAVENKKNIFKLRRKKNLIFQINQLRSIFRLMLISNYSYYNKFALAFNKKAATAQNSQQLPQLPQEQNIIKKKIINKFNRSNHNLDVFNYIKFKNFKNKNLGKFNKQTTLLAYKYSYQKLSNKLDVKLKYRFPSLTRGNFRYSLKDNINKDKVLYNYVNNLDFYDLIKWSILFITLALVPLKNKNKNINNKFYGLKFYQLLENKGFFNLNFKPVNNPVQPLKPVENPALDKGQGVNFNYNDFKIYEKINIDNYPLISNVINREVSLPYNFNNSNSNYNSNLNNKNIKQINSSPITLIAPIATIAPIAPIAPIATASNTNWSNWSEANKFINLENNIENKDNQIENLDIFNKNDNNTNINTNNIDLIDMDNNNKKFNKTNENKYITTYFPGAKFIDNWKDISKIIWQEEYKFNLYYKRVKTSLNLANNNANNKISAFYAIITVLKLWDTIIFTTIKSISALKIKDLFFYSRTRNATLIHTKKNIFKKPDFYITNIICASQINLIENLKFIIIDFIFNNIDKFKKKKKYIKISLPLPNINMTHIKKRVNNIAPKLIYNKYMKPNYKFKFFYSIHFFKLLKHKFNQKNLFYKIINSHHFGKEIDDNICKFKKSFVYNLLNNSFVINNFYKFFLNEIHNKTGNNITHNNFNLTYDKKAKIIKKKNFIKKTQPFGNLIKENNFYFSSTYLNFKLNLLINHINKVIPSIFSSLFKSFKKGTVNYSVYSIWLHLLNNHKFDLTILLKDFAKEKKKQ